MVDDGVELWLLTLVVCLVCDSSVVAVVFFNVAFLAMKVHFSLARIHSLLIIVGLSGVRRLLGATGRKR